MNKDTLMNFPLSKACGAVRHDHFFKTDKDAFNSIKELSGIAKKQGVKAMLDREYPDTGAKNIIVNIIDGKPYVIDGNRHCVSLLLAEPYLTFGDLEALCPGILRIWYAGVEEGSNTAENPYQVYIPIDVDVSSIPGAHRGIDFFKTPPAPTNIVPGSFPPDSELLPDVDRGLPLSETVTALIQMLRSGDVPNDLPGSDIVPFPVVGGNIYIDVRKGLVTDCDRSVTEAVIPEKVGDFDVIAINSHAFSNCGLLEKVTIPNSVVFLGQSAFYDCVSLREVSLPKNLVNGGWSIFHGCKSLESITLPESMTEVYPMMFMLCTNIKSIYIPNSVGFISFNAFTYCESLKSVRLPANIEISNKAFSDCTGIEKVFFHGSRSQWDSLAIGYGNEALTEAHVFFPDDLSIAEANPPEPAYEYCPGSGGYGSSGANLPYRTEAGTVYIDTVKGQLLGSDEDIRGTFYLSPIDCNVRICTIGTDAFNRRTGLSSIVFPDSVTFIGNAAFYGCSGLSIVTMPPKLEILGDDAFSCCSGLLSVVFPGNSTNRLNIGGGAFARCEQLTSATFLGSISSIGSGAFYDCGKLMSITFNSTVDSIESYAFSGCSSLCSITLPDSLGSIGEGAFERCENLSTVYFKGTKDQWDRISVGSGNDALTGAELLFLS